MWDIKKTEDGKWEWTFFNSAYGAAGGLSKTLEEAKVELAIAQADIMEYPFPAAVELAMREDPVRFAAEYPNPEGLNGN